MSFKDLLTKAAIKTFCKEFGESFWKHKLHFLRLSDHELEISEHEKYDDKWVSPTRGSMYMLLHTTCGNKTWITI